MLSISDWQYKVLVTLWCSCKEEIHLQINYINNDNTDVTKVFIIFSYLFLKLVSVLVISPLSCKRCNIQA